jgi:hypothetical protein
MAHIAVNANELESNGFVNPDAGIIRQGDSGKHVAVSLQFHEVEQ